MCSVSLWEVLEWLLSFLPSACGDSDTFSSGFCFFSLPQGFGKQHHIEVMPVLKSPGQGCSGACRDQGGLCPTPKLCSWIFHFSPSLSGQAWVGGALRWRRGSSPSLAWHFKVILITQFIPGRHFSQGRPTRIIGKSSVFAVGFSPKNLVKVFSGDFLPSSSNPDLQLLVL